MSSESLLWGHRLPVTALALSARGLDKDVNLSQKRGRPELVEDKVHLAPPLLVACARVAKSHLQIESG